jgi:hypothetical protein
MVMPGSRLARIVMIVVTVLIVLGLLVSAISFPATV